MKEPRELLDVVEPSQDKLKDEHNDSIKFQPMNTQDGAKGTSQDKEIDS